MTATTLATKWETSTKTVQRLVDNLRDEFGAPLLWDARRGTYHYSDTGWHLPWLAMRGADLFAVGVAMKVLQMYEGTPIAKDMKAIFERLSELMPPEVRIAPSSFVEKLYIRPQAQRPVDPKVWDAVATALREKVVLEADYRKPTGQGGWRELEPLHVVLFGTDWFLLGRDPEGDEVKTFYLSRMKDARVGTRRFSPPKGFRPRSTSATPSGSTWGSRGSSSASGSDGRSRSGSRRSAGTRNRSWSGWPTVPSSWSCRRGPSWRRGGSSSPSAGTRRRSRPPSSSPTSGSTLRPSRAATA